MRCKWKFYIIFNQKRLKERIDFCYFIFSFSADWVNKNCVYKPVYEKETDLLSRLIDSLICGWDEIKKALCNKIHLFYLGEMKIELLFSPFLDIFLVYLCMHSTTSTCEQAKKLNPLPHSSPFQCCELWSTCIVYMHSSIVWWKVILIICFPCF